ncbi:hypothetical protein HOT32_gp08 [Erwinia phage Faunus]|uniref:Uncharacterized protein n=1 Tax=Erwinia phage Faunus TaxID=2182346 RepID=A0A2U8UWG6_9CAUD|nr:hypothetical protein HOT32_gp08 [Erwinia phage Faunus]AWN08591.1 hypothetical protein [Erwinia phage Faunus]
MTDKDILKSLLYMSNYGADLKALVAIEMPDGTIVMLQPSRVWLANVIEDELKEMRARENALRGFFDSASLIGKTMKVSLSNNLPKCPYCGGTDIKVLEHITKDNVGKCKRCSAILDLDMLNAKSNGIQIPLH